jgi:hypothetical protein
MTEQMLDYHLGCSWMGNAGAHAETLGRYDCVFEALVAYRTARVPDCDRRVTWDHTFRLTRVWQVGNIIERDVVAERGVR